MKKDKRNIFILIMIIILAVVISYLLFFSGLTNKLKANVNELKVSVNDDINASDLPIIDGVINSSGESLVNTDVALIINASSKYKITKVEYSFDLKKWKIIKGNYDKNEITSKLVFSDDMNKQVYIRVQNEYGYRSYAYKTFVNIDKEKPIVIMGKNNNDVVIKAKDNNGLSSIQYSSDNLNWQEDEISGESIILTKNLPDGTYVRVVDSAGNISDAKKID